MPVIIAFIRGGKGRKGIISEWVPIIKFYANRILTGRMTLEEVPVKYRDKVKKYLEDL